MRTRSRLLKWLARLTILCVNLAAVVCTAMYGSARLYSRQLESLSERIKSLRVGGSTFEDTRTLLRDYQNDIVFEHAGCGRERCAFTIRLSNTHFPAFYDAPLMWRVGIRPTFAAAVLRIENDKLRYASFGLLTRTQYSYWLEASFSAAPALTMYDKCHDTFLRRDSTYAVSGAHLSNGDGGGWIVRTAFGVGASPEERRKATTFSLSCITSLPSCKETKDLMPEAYRDLSFEPNRNESFKKDCESYVRSVKVGPGPWSVESAFEADPFSLTTWDLPRY